tara:strand:- start:908 stop:1228 length:321 start_codon:yes stop_codon:yes gene_type:complete
MKKVILFTALITPLIVGYIQYSNTYLFPKWKIFLNGVAWSIPLSLGLILSTLKVGRKFKFLTSIIIIVSTFMRSTMALQLEMWIVIPIMLIEIYAVYSLFIEKKNQ